jgi:hypothetical protein
MRCVGQMNKPFILCLALMFSTACGTQKQSASKPVLGVQAPPFALAVVPGRGGITMANHMARDFYVVLTNVSKEPQPVWEDWNSWGYQTISFEFTEADGEKVVVRRRQGNFTRNFPSTFLVQPGEHQVYAVKLDDRWETQGVLPKVDEMQITLKAIYEVTSTPESAQYKVWTGRIESHSYNFTLRQW